MIGVCVCVCVCGVWSFIDGARAYTAETDRLSLGGWGRMGLGLVGRRDPHLRCYSHSLQNQGTAHTTQTYKTVRVAKSGWEDLGHLSYSAVFPGIWNSLYTPLAALGRPPSF